MYEILKKDKVFSPFPTGTPVRGENLIGREDEISQIIKLLQNHQSVILIGPRKYGKTSILLEVLERLKKNGFFVGRIDLFQTSSKKELAEGISEAVLENRKAPFKNTIKIIKRCLTTALKHIEIRQAVKDFEFILSFADPGIDEDSLLDTTLDFPEGFAKKYKRHLILAFDEFGDIKKLDGDKLIKKMRSKFQLQEDVTYIFTGSQESLMEELFANRHQAFFRFGRILHIGELPEKELKEYIVRTFQRLRFSISGEVATKIIFKTNAHPYYCQLVCQLIYFSLKGERRKIKEEDVEENFIRAIFSEKSYFDQLWSDLMGEKYLLSVLKSIALERESPYKTKDLYNHNPYRSLSALEKKGLIKKIGRGKYKIRDPLFKEYIKMREQGTF